MGNKKDLLVTLADRKFLQQAKQLFSSVYWNAGWKGDYMILSHQIPENELKWFRDKGILVKECETLFDKSIGRDYSLIVFDKFYLFKTEFKKWENVIYLDSDIIVRGGLNRLTKINGFASVKSFLKIAGEFSDKSELLIDIRKKYSLEKKAFCTGIMAFSTKIITENTFNDLKKIFIEFEKIFLFGEEGALNLYFYNNWKRLPNVFGMDITPIAHLKIRPNDIHALVLHFIRFENKELYKPWNSENPYFEEWTANAKKADLMDLNIVQEIKPWNLFQITYYSWLYDFYLKYCTKFCKTMTLFFPLNSFIFSSLDRFAGWVGKCLKKCSPKLYIKLKKT
jgi:lipopolysaccharide biosynthesis glycosyltransferase